MINLNLHSVDSVKPSYEIKLLYDGECPLCMREVNFLRRKDAGTGKVIFVDIADDNYSPDDHAGIDYETAMGRIHAILADGTVITNVEVFQGVYEILGMGWVYALTKIPLIGFFANKVYELWAKLRFKLTGRDDLATIILKKQERLCSNNKNCKI